MKKKTYLALGCITGISLLAFLVMVIIYAIINENTGIFYESLITITPYDIMHFFFVIFILGFIVLIILLIFDLIKYLENKKANNEKDNKD